MSANIFNDINLVMRDEYEQLQPPKKEFIKNKFKFDFQKIKKDWVLLDKTYKIDKNLLEKENNRIKHVIKTQPNRTKFSAWAVMPIFHMQLDSFLLTMDEKYLDNFIYLYDYFLSVRMDKQNRKNYQGQILPQWERIDRYNIFTVSPFKKYELKKKELIMKKRAWKNLFFSDTNYSGLYLDPILRFVQIIKENQISKYYTKSDEILKDALNVIESHEEEWVKVSKTEGYYIFPKNSPFFLDGVEIPVNEVAIFGSVLARAYMLTNDKFYLNRALSMWNRWEKYITKDNFGYISYSYWTGKPFHGWNKNNSPSINTPEFMTKYQKQYENFHKTALTINFLILLEQAKKETTAKYLKEFFYSIMATLDINNIVSDYPGLQGFGYPYNSHHSVLPYNSQGWLHLALQSDEFNDKVSNQILVDLKTKIADILYFQYIAEKSIDDFSMISFTDVVFPKYTSDKNQTCMFKSPIDTTINIKFYRTSPKNNRLYLYFTNDDKKRVRLDIKDGIFQGRIFAKKNQCIDIRWKKSKYGSPKDEKENRLYFTFFISKKKFLQKYKYIKKYEVIPRFLDENENICLIKPAFSGIMEINFKHITPKNNKLFLYDHNYNNKKIKLKVNGNEFIGHIFVKKNQCIDLRWKKSKYGSPNTKKENIIYLKYKYNSYIPIEGF